MDYREFTDEELKWIKSLQRCMNKAPENLFIFAAGGSFSIYPKDENGNRYMVGGSVDSNAPSEIVNMPCESDGGDW